jgi:hypothetical protein
MDKCAQKNRLFIKTKFLNQILNLQTRIQKCANITGTLNFILNMSLNESNKNSAIDKVPDEEIKAFEIESTLEKINLAENEIRKKLNAITLALNLAESNSLQNTTPP